MEKWHEEQDKKAAAAPPPPPPATVGGPSSPGAYEMYGDLDSLAMGDDFDDDDPGRSGHASGYASGYTSGGEELVRLS